MRPLGEGKVGVFETLGATDLCWIEYSAGELAAYLRHTAPRPMKISEAILRFADRHQCSPWSHELRKKSIPPAH